MKRISIFLLTIATCLSIFTHPGRTEGDGGHYNRSTEEYHYHHGYPEHQHRNGVCPYNYEDDTNEDSNKTLTSREAKDKTKEFSLISVIEWFSLLGGIGYVIAYCFGPTIKENRRWKKNKKGR